MLAALQKRGENHEGSRRSHARASARPDSASYADLQYRFCCDTCRLGRNVKMAFSPVDGRSPGMQTKGVRGTCRSAHVRIHRFFFFLNKALALRGVGDGPLRDWADPAFDVIWLAKFIDYILPLADHAAVKRLYPDPALNNPEPPVPGSITFQYMPPPQHPHAHARGKPQSLRSFRTQMNRLPPSSESNDHIQGIEVGSALAARASQACKTMKAAKAIAQRSREETGGRADGHLISLILATAPQYVMTLSRLHCLGFPISLIWIRISHRYSNSFPPFPTCCSSHSFHPYHYLTTVSRFTSITAE